MRTLSGTQSQSHRAAASALHSPRHTTARVDRNVGGTDHEESRSKISSMLCEAITYWQVAQEYLGGGSSEKDPFGIEQTTNTAKIGL